MWGNKGSGRVRVKYARALGGRFQAAAAEFVQPAGSAYGEGPFETLTPREFRHLLSDERGKSGCTTLFPETHYGARYYTATNGTVRIPYRIDPGGAKGELILEPSPKRGATDQGLPLKVREVRHLRCGRQAVDGRPAGCKTPQALLIRDGKPAPAELKVRRRDGCVVWGNKGERTLRVESEPCSRCFFSLNLRPGEAAVTYFRAAVERLPHPIRYTIEPDGAGPSGGEPRAGAKGTILLESR